MIGADTVSAESVSETQRHVYRKELLVHSWLNPTSNSSFQLPVLKTGLGRHFLFYFKRHAVKLYDDTMIGTGSGETYAFNMLVR